LIQQRLSSSEDTQVAAFAPLATFLSTTALMALAILSWSSLACCSQFFLISTTLWDSWRE